MIRTIHIVGEDRFSGVNEEIRQGKSLLGRMMMYPVSLM